MSLPSFPEIDPELTHERSLDMVLASIAMEELALSHIMNAEGEKLQYILGTLETSHGLEPTTQELLCVNKSITSLLDSVTNNQILLKGKMEKVLEAQSGECPGRIGPTGPTGPTGPCCVCPSRCSASFKGASKCDLWCPGLALSWRDSNIRGKCACIDPCDDTRVLLLSKGRFQISFHVNACSKAAHADIVIRLKLMARRHFSDIFTLKDHLVRENVPVTLGASGIIVESDGHHTDSFLQLKLISDDSLWVENSTISIVEI